MIENETIKKYLFALIPITMILVLPLIFVFVATPEEITNWLGTKNSYFLIFIFSFIGGLSTFSGIPYHIILVTMAIGGLNPFILGVSAAIGVTLGDFASYYLGYRGGDLAPTFMKNFFQKIYDWSLAHPKAFPLLCFLYGSLVPFSNDFIVIPAGILRYPFWAVMIPLGIGNTIFNIGIAFLSTHAYTFIQGIFF